MWWILFFFLDVSVFLIRCICVQERGDKKTVMNNYAEIKYYLLNFLDKLLFSIYHCKLILRGSR